MTVGRGQKPDEGRHATGHFARRERSDRSRRIHSPMRDGSCDFTCGSAQDGASSLASAFADSRSPVPGPDIKNPDTEGRLPC